MNELIKAVRQYAEAMDELREAADAAIEELRAEADARMEGE